MSNEWVMVPREPTKEMTDLLWLELGDHPSREHAKDAWRSALDAAPAAPQQAELSGDDLSVAFKRGWDAALATAPKQAEPVVYRKYLDGVDAHVYRLVPRDDEADKWEPLYLHPPAAEVQRLRDALEYLIEKCGESDDAQYGTLGTRFVRNIARRALEGK